MPTIAIFEDHFDTVYTVHEVVGHHHEVVGAAANIHESHQLLRKMALNEVQADYTLVDANLDNPFDYTYSPFRFVPPDKELPAPDPKKRFQLSRRQKVNPDEVVVEHEGKQNGADGRFILRVIKACEIPTTTINLSGDNKGLWDTDGLIDKEMTKDRLRSLLAIIAEVEASRTDR